MPIPANFTFTATPVDRSLVMRALGGAITSPCSNDSESRRPTPTIFESPRLLVYRWMLLDSPIQITALSGRLLIVFCIHTWLVQLPLQNRIICMLNSFVSADRRATARTTTSLSHAAIRQKKNRVRALTSEFVRWTGRCLPLSTKRELIQGFQRSLALSHNSTAWSSDLEPYGGLPLHCLDIRTTLTLIIEAPTG